MGHTVKFGQNASLELIMSGLEAFNGAKLKTSKFKAVETLGHLWGYRRTSHEETFHVIEHISISALARRKPGSVSSKPGVLKLKNAVATYLRPELTLLGDFHTHPYRDQAEVINYNGWEDSDPDRQVLLGDEELWQLSSAPLMIVLAMCKMNKVHETNQIVFRSNVLRFNIAEYRFWLSAFVGTEVAGRRRVSSRKKSDVSVSPLPLEVWNNSGERLIDYAR